MIERLRLIWFDFHFDYGISDVFSGTVCQLGEGGIQRTFELPLTAEEKEKVVAAANATKELVALIKA